VFVLGQLASGLFVERINSQARAIEEIAQKLVIYASVYSSCYSGSLDNVTKRKLEEVQMDFRRLAALLSSTIQTLSWYALFEALHLVKSRDQVRIAVAEIIGLSNTIGTGEDRVKAALEHRRSICQCLGLRDD
jgi:hypothetical protein